MTTQPSPAWTASIGRPWDGTATPPRFRRFTLELPSVAQSRDPPTRLRFRHLPNHRQGPDKPRRPDGNSPRGRCPDEARCGAGHLRPTSACGRSQSRHFCPNGPSGSARFSSAYVRILAVASLSEVARQTTSIVEHAATLQDQLLWSAGSDRDLATITAALSQLCDAHPFPAFWVHGDFAPWNIKHRSDGLPALLDWEDARRGGLPLQDAFHFLHIQDYLFGERPTSHAERLNRFASEIGVSAAHCRKLEIAYLAHSYLQRLTQRQTKHSEFLLDTLRVALQDGQHAAEPSYVRRNQFTPPAKLASSPAALHIRSDLFSAVDRRIQPGAIALLHTQRLRRIS